MATCTNCGAENPDRAKFCLECGTALAIDEKPEIRKTVTMVFTDLSGSTAMGEKLDPESTRRLMGRYFGRMREVLESHGGTVEKFIGDAVMAVFGIPTLHEDDALRAVRAAVGMRQALAELNVEFQSEFDVTIQVRTGVNTGEVVAGDPATGQNMVTGDAVNVAARLEQTAGPGEILIGEQTYALARAAVEAEPVEPLTLKGKSEPVPAYRVLSVAATGEGFGRRLDSPLVGRERELQMLQDAFDRSLEDRRCHLFTVFGSAGAGKSRLTSEFISLTADRARTINGRCLAYGEGITYWPIAEMVKDVAMIADGDSSTQAIAKIASLLPADDEAQLIAQRVASLISLHDEPTSAEEGFWAVRRLFEGLGRVRPIVVLIDDIHWAEPTLLDLIEYVVGWSSDAPIFLLCTAREELLEVRPSLGIPKPNATSVLLEPLTKEHSRKLIENLLGEAHISDAVSERITDAAEGNPLYVEEMLRMLIDDGLLEKRDGRWTTESDLTDIEVPPTINALLSARLDRLDLEERAVIQRGSVIGKTFWWGAIAELSEAAERTSVGPKLQTLVRKELIRPERSLLEGEDAFRFGHILVRDAAYQGMGKEQRSDLHAKFHDWLAGKVGGGRADYEEILGYHLERAALYRRELGRIDDSVATLEARAADHLFSAGQRARLRSDLHAAVGLLGRATALMSDGDIRKSGALLELAEAQIELGELAASRTVLEDILERAADDRLLEAHTKIMLSYLATHLDADVESGRDVARSAIEIFESFQDERGLARAYQLLAETFWFELKYQEVEQNLARAIDHARAAGDERQVASSRRWLVSSLLYGPTPAPQAIEMCKEILAEAGDDRLLVAFCVQSQAGLEAMAGDFEEAQRLSTQGLTILRDLGIAFSLASSGMLAGTIQYLAGDLEAAELDYLRAYDSLQELGDRSYLATAAGELARILVERGKLDEAERYVEICRELTSEDDVISMALWRGVKARILTERGRVEKAEPLAREAVSLVAPTDDTRGHADALADLATVLEKAGRSEESSEARKRALELYEEKGVVPMVRRLEGLAAGA